MTNDPTASRAASDPLLVSDTPIATATPIRTDNTFLPGVRSTFGRQRTLAEKALAQVDDLAFFTVVAEDGNSLAVLAQHVGGNLRSRFTDFLSTDGEKSDRHRDQEFEIAEGEARETVMSRWTLGWHRLESTLQSLGSADLSRTVTIRGEPYSVVEALLRALDHIAYHTGQIVLLARHHCGASWQSLSVPRGGSDAYSEAVRRGEVSQRRVVGCQSST